MNLYLKIGFEYESMFSDSSINFFNKALSLVEKKLSENDLTDTDKEIFIRFKADIFNIHGDNYYDRGFYLKSLDYYTKALKIFQSTNDLKLESNCLNNIGLSYCYSGQYPEALNSFFEALKIREKLEDRKGCSDCLNNIGLVWYSQNNFEKASEYYSKSLAIDEELGDSASISAGYNNIGLSYFFQLKYQKALEYYAKSLDIRKRLNDKNGIAECTFNIGILYLDSALFSESKKYLFESLKIYKSIKNKQGECAVNRELANLTNKEGNYKLAIKYANESLKIAASIELIGEVRIAHSYLYESYKLLNDYKQALFHHERYKKITDSLYNSEKTNTIANLEALYKNEKVQKEIELLNKDKELQKIEIKRQTTQKYAFIVGFILMLGITILALFSYRKIKTQHKIIEYKNSELSQQNEEITAQRDEIEHQRQEISLQKDVAESQRDLIMFQNVEITDSIKYAKRIQEAMLPKLSVIASNEAIFPLQSHRNEEQYDTFIFFRPKDIVSGDFYWFLKRGDNLIIAVADCTGHGVPGAFMSMLGISFLNEIVRRKEVTQANHVLNNLRTSIVNALQQKGISGEQKDGMDISLIAIKLQDPSSKSQVPREKEKVREGESEKYSVESNQYSIISKQLAYNEPQTTNEILKSSNPINPSSDIFHAQWAGANNPLWLVRNDETLTGFKTLSEFSEDASANNEQQTTTELASSTKLNHKLFELKPDKMPIAIYERMDSFTNHELQLNKGDCIYLMSDGYADQFGGPKGKKFLSKNLKQLLIDNSQLDMNEQKDKLFTTFENWRGNHEQIDDVTVLGIKI